MSDQEEPRPLTRRELRLQAMAAEEAAQTGPENAGRLSERPSAPEMTAQESTRDGEHRPGHGGHRQEQSDPEVAAPEPVIETDEEIEISPVDENGVPRTRREIRELREQAAAERARIAQAFAPVSEEPEVEVPELHDVAEPVQPAESPEAAASTESLDESASVEVQAPVEEPERSEAPEVAVAPESEFEPVAVIPSEDADALEDEIELSEEIAAPKSAFGPAVDEHRDSDEARDVLESLSDDNASDVVAEDVETADFEVGEPTQPFSVDDLLEAEQLHEDDARAPAEETVQAGDSSKADGHSEDVDSDDAEGEAVAKSRRRLPWMRGSKHKDDAATETDLEPSSAVSATNEDAELVESIEVDNTDLEEPENLVAAEPVAESAAESDGREAVVESETESPVKESPDSNAGGYSFPNIEPPEEWRSVFDDPATRVAPTAPRDRAESTENFDDLISRAVTQEGSTKSTGASALILPSMPDTPGYSGPLGGTGELFVTGSIELPKSLGETGGHASLHDSVESDSIEDMGAPSPAVDERDGGPVSARRAVSAMSNTGVPSVSEVQKDKSKLPLVLSLTGGGLIVVVGGVVAWGFANGVFG